jgi:addiction module HigA family antidote
VHRKLRLLDAAGRLDDLRVTAGNRLGTLGVGQLEAAKQLGVSLNRLNEIVLGKRGMTADTALRLGRFLKAPPQLWMRLQADWDQHQAIQREGRKAS